MSARVLVVDDILPNVKLLEAKLTSEYYDVLTATSGKEALEKVKTESPDIVLLDVMMPEMDGFEVCQIIKEDNDTSHIPVVMVTALTDAADRVRGLESGADDFLSKPLNDTALMARVRSLVRLKMTVDEWRTRENTASQLGVVDENATVMSESAEGARVLVVEDQSFESEKFVETLAEDKDVVIVTETGASAMEKIGEADYDLLVISLNLENEDGLRLVSHLRSAERTRHVPILMIGGQDDMSRVAHGLEIGAHDYILRPVDRNELLARVRTQVRRKRFQERLRSTFEISLSMALTDDLTGLYNRRYFEVHLQKLLEKNKTSKKSLGVLMMDIDHFKNINDTYGHNVGDEILKVFSERIQDNLRSFDLVARLGGEEFIALLPDVGDEKAKFVAERLRR
ncbi:MAG: PleD family two-component system response regulator, partial [Pseudomonadota bacterium]